MTVRSFDLFGKPVLGPGRPDHEQTPENVEKVRALALAGWQVPEIARELGVSAPTLRKYYFSTIDKARAEARRVYRARAIMALQVQADRGNVGAIKALLKILDGDELRAVPVRQVVPAAVSMGKKEQRKLAARSPRGNWGELMGAPPAEAMN